MENAHSSTTPKFAFCHGWTLTRDFSEETCKRRESCAYYSVDFYREHGHHLDDFDEMFPMQPCTYYVERKWFVKKKESEEKDLFFQENDSE